MTKCLREEAATTATTGVVGQWAARAYARVRRLPTHAQSAEAKNLAKNGWSRTTSGGCPFRDITVCRCGHTSEVNQKMTMIGAEAIGMTIQQQRRLRRRHRNARAERCGCQIAQITRGATSSVSCCLAGKPQLLRMQLSLSIVTVVVAVFCYIDCVSFQVSAFVVPCHRLDGRITTISPYRLSETSLAGPPTTSTSSPEKLGKRMRFLPSLVSRNGTGIQSRKQLFPSFKIPRLSPRFLAVSLLGMFVGWFVNRPGPRNGIFGAPIAAAMGGSSFGGSSAGSLVPMNR
jgi:hypothetical protein